jgi:hypothetical protein
MDIGTIPNLENEDETTPEFNKRLRTAYKYKRLTVPDKNKLRNLKQYKNLTDDEFDEKFIKKAMNVETNRDWEKRIQIKLEEFRKDYDLDDLKINDIQGLRALASSVIRLEDYDTIIGKLLEEGGGVSENNILVVERLSSIQQHLREGISKIQDDLKISRKTRHSEKEEDAVTFIEELKKKAKKFYEQRMMYIFCPECHELLATIWFQYPQFKTNVIKLKCHREFPDQRICNGEVTITSEWLLAHGMRNLDNIPDSMK